MNIYILSFFVKTDQIPLHGKQSLEIVNNRLFSIISLDTEYVEDNSWKVVQVQVLVAVKIYSS
jgi:hypothetical protein